MKKILILAFLAIIFGCSEDEQNESPAANSSETGNKFYLNGKLQSMKFEDASDEYVLVVHGEKRIDAFSSEKELAKAPIDERIYKHYLLAEASLAAANNNSSKEMKTIEEIEEKFINKSSINKDVEDDFDPHDIYDSELGIPNHSDDLVMHWVRHDVSWFSIPLKTTYDVHLDLHAVYDATGRRDFYNQYVPYLFGREHTIKNHSETWKILYLQDWDDHTWHVQFFPPNSDVDHEPTGDWVRAIYVSDF